MGIDVPAWLDLKHTAVVRGIPELRAERRGMPARPRHLVPGIGLGRPRDKTTREKNRIKRRDKSNKFPACRLFILPITTLVRRVTDSNKKTLGDSQIFGRWDERRIIVIRLKFNEL